MNSTGLLRAKTCAGALCIGALALLTAGADAVPAAPPVLATDATVIAVSLTAAPGPSRIPSGACAQTSRWRHTPLRPHLSDVTTPKLLPIAGCAG